MNMRPDISLVMATLNAEAFIGDALDSVAEQDCPDLSVEIVVADGGSHDRTRAIAAAYPFVRILEGTDNGIYQGFNRGIAAASGDILGILNADDRLAKGALKEICRAFSHIPTAEYVSAGITASADAAGGLSMYHRGKLTMAGILFGVPAVNGRFFKRSLMLDLNGFAPDAGLAADREFLVRLMQAGARGVVLDKPLYHYRIHAKSHTIAGDADARQRIYNAEITLFRYLENSGQVQRGDQIWLQRGRALTRLKGLLLAMRRGNVLFTCGQGLSFSDVMHLPSAVVAWRRYRGRLSGY